MNNNLTCLATIGDNVCKPDSGREKAEEDSRRIEGSLILNEEIRGEEVLGLRGVHSRRGGRR